MKMQWIVPSILLAGRFVLAAPYDPLAVPPAAEPTTVELTVHDTERQRELPIKVYLPASTDAAPVILFSHGLGGSRDGSQYLGRHWSARGYVSVFLQHPGSDESIWKDLPIARRFAAFQQAASAKNYLLRVQDVPAVLDQLERWNSQPDHVLYQRLDMRHIGMSGHSFGAQTTQAVSGQAAAIGGQRYLEPRIQAAVIMSPSAPKVGTAERAFGKVKLPWLLMTGTRDSAPIGGQTVASRREVFPALPPGDKYELVLHDAEHSAFTDRPLPGDQVARNPNHHRAILAISTAFWDTYLKHDAAAKAWLTGSGPRSVLEPEDVWQSK